MSCTLFNWAIWLVPLKFQRGTFFTLSFPRPRVMRWETKSVEGLQKCHAQCKKNWQPQTIDTVLHISYVKQVKFLVMYGEVLRKAKQNWLLDSHFKVFKIVCGRAVIFYYSIWLKSWENSAKSFINTIISENYNTIMKNF